MKDRIRLVRDEYIRFKAILSNEHPLVIQIAHDLAILERPYVRGLFP